MWWDWLYLSLNFLFFSLHFQSYLLKNVFTIPEDVVLPEDRVQITHPLSLEEDRQLDTEMEQLRKHIIAVSIHLFSRVATFCYDLYMEYCNAIVLTLEFYLFFGYFCIKVNLGLQTKYRKLKMHLNFYVFCVYFFTRFCFVDLSGSVWKWMCETAGQRYRESTETCR